MRAELCHIRGNMMGIKSLIIRVLDRCGRGKEVHVKTNCDNLFILDCHIVITSHVVMT